MSAYYFQTKNLAVGYDGQTLIRDITIGVEKGEIVTLIGPNGAGKSTILKSITRQLKTIAGTVVIDSAELKRLSLKELATRMAVVLTERMKPELMTCRDIVATGRYPYTGRLGILTAEDEAKVDAAMGIHVFTNMPLPVGTVMMLGPDSVMAAVDWFTIRITGHGCHGAQPNNGVDPLIVQRFERPSLSRDDIVDIPLSPFDASIALANHG